MPTISSKPAIVLDFDRVLFDADAFRLSLRGAVKPLGISAKRWQTAYEHSLSDGVFRIVEMAEQLAAGTEQPVAKIMEAFAAETEDAAWYLYGDSRPFLDRLIGHCDLYLLTLGDRGLQQQKVAACGIEPWFSGVYYVEEPKAVANTLPIPSVERAIFVNDNVTEMLELAQLYRWSHHLHVNRGKPVEKPMPFPSYHDLRETGDAIIKLLEPTATQRKSRPSLGSTGAIE